MDSEKSFGLEIYSSSERFFQGRARLITLPSTDGGHTFLPHHENTVIALVPGITDFISSRGSAEIRWRQESRKKE